MKRMPSWSQNEARTFPAGFCTWNFWGAVWAPMDHLLPVRLYHTLPHYLIWGGIQNIPDWCRHLYSSCSSAKHRSEQPNWIPGSTVTFAATAWKRAKTSPRTLARTNLAASPWQRPRLTLRPHPAVSGEIQHSYHPPFTVLPWFGTLLLLSIFKNEIEAERTSVW
jgi:hypothetical protein